MDNNQDEPQDDAAANAVAVAAAIAAARILEERYCLEVCGLNQQMTDTIILEGYSKTSRASKWTPSSISMATLLQTVEASRSRQ